MNERAKPLRGIDQCLVTYEKRCGRSVGIGLLLRFDGEAPDLSQLVRHLAERFSTVPELRWLLGESRGRSVWYPDPRFSWDSRIAQYSGYRADGETGLRAAVGDIAAMRLDPATAPWRAWLLRGFAPGQWALMLHVHHALADGQSMMSLAHRAFGERSSLSRPSRSWITPRRLSRRESWAKLLRGGPRQAWNLVPRRFPTRNANGDHRVDWATFDSAQVRRIAAHHDATVNDVVLALTTRTLSTGDTTPYALIPVSTRSADDTHRLGNELTTMRVPLPKRHQDPVSALKAITAATTQAKHGRDIDVSRAGAEVLPSWVFASLFRHALTGGYVDIIVSNWGTTPALAFHDNPVRELVPIMFRPPGHATTIGFATHGNRTHVGVVSTSDTDRLRDHWHSALTSLHDSAE
ncbi:wax ester/triacylglycerol synthase domain-containing protein [Stackebrandtia nassauensis]|uniref:wax ester/triacylglycerol synthase domain-containing protein n=1 Tax=Stackebrandtia nassauensis TaxID=283811 RepID=UPI0001A3ADB1|nr:wax ester/triacylglycerol synthase domain-containing protein [Stackebrandtia nassauensis]